MIPNFVLKGKQKLGKERWGGEHMIREEKVWTGSQTQGHACAEAGSVWQMGH